MKEKSQPALIRSIFCWLQLPAAPAFLLGGNRAKAAPPRGPRGAPGPPFCLPGDERMRPPRLSWSARRHSKHSWSSARLHRVVAAAPPLRCYLPVAPNGSEDVKDARCDEHLIRARRVKKTFTRRLELHKDITTENIKLFVVTSNLSVQETAR